MSLTRASSHPPSDFSHLLRRLKQGEQDALESLYLALFDTLWSIAVLQTRSSDTAQDVVQDVFVWLWLHRDRIADDTNIRVYLATAVRNRARNLGRHDQMVERTHTRFQNQSVDVPAFAMPFPLSDRIVEDAEFRQAYQQALGLLSERERTAVLLRWDEGFTLEQIAEVLEISVVGARGVILRVQQKLREALASYHP